MTFSMFALVGCAEIAITSQGVTQYLEKTKMIHCLTWDACFSNADQLCKTGYNILSQSDVIGKEIEVVCTEDQFPKMRDSISGKKAQDTNTVTQKKKVPTIENSQGNQQVEKIMDLKP